MSKMINTAIYGGTFDPVHIGHIDVAKAVLEEGAADEVVFMPNYVSPFKQNEVHSSGVDRMNMIKEATRDIEHVYVSTYELNREGPSYTIETLEEMEKSLGGKVSFILGADSLLTLETWYRGSEIIKNYRIIAVHRPDVDYSETKRAVNLYKRKYSADVILLKTIPHDVSSTEIRKKVNQNEKIKGLVTQAVAEYIESHNLYANLYEINDKLTKIMKSKISKKRFIHSIGVADMAKKLARIYGEDPDKAYFAGYVHDIAKCLSIEEANRLVRYYGLGGKYLYDLNLAHSKIGAALAEELLNVNDAEVLNAISYHTTARAEMTCLEEILYVADAIEINRTYKEASILREKAKYNLDEVCLFILDFCIEDLKKKNRFVDRDTIDAREWIYNKIKKRSLNEK